MSAGNLGSRLLEEVQVERLDELLRTLRTTYEKQHAQLYTSQDGIDQILRAFIEPNTLPRQHYHSTTVHGTIAKPNQTPVLELVGVSPCSGKTQLLHHLIALSLLPSEHDGYQLGGKGSAVVMFDLGSRISMLRLRTVMINHVQSCISKSSELAQANTIIKLVQSSLEHLHMFRPQTSRSLLATLSNLESYILNTTSHLSANRQVSLIILHHVDAFLWQDRLEDAEDPTNENKTVQKSPLFSGRFRDLVAHLRRLQAMFGCLIVATSSALSPMAYVRIDGLVVPTLRSHLPNAWRSFVTLRLLVKRYSVRRFPLGMSVEEAAREADQRREIVEKYIFSAQLDWSESDSWREETRNAVKALESAEQLSFSFKIDANGVHFDVED